MTKEINNKVRNNIQAVRSVNIEDSMQNRKKMKKLNINFNDINKLPPFSFIVLYDPVCRTNCCGMVNLDSISFVFYEKSFNEMPAEIGVKIAPRAMLKMFEIELITDKDFHTMTQNEHIGRIFVELYEKINNVTREKYNVVTESMITVLNAMYFLDLISTQEKTITLTAWEEKAKAITKSNIDQAVKFALRQREAKHIIESDIIAANL